MRRRRALLALAGAVLLATAPPTLSQPKPGADLDHSKSDAALLRDDAKATGELQRRLRAQVAYRNGLLIIQDNSGGDAPEVMVMPATAMWSIDCGDSGISVTFGSGTGDTENGISVQLTSAAVAADKCQRIAPALGEALVELTKGN
jgi:hypothetical protein